MQVVIVYLLTYVLGWLESKTFSSISPNSFELYVNICRQTLLNQLADFLNYWPGCNGLKLRIIIKFYIVSFS